MNRGTILFFLCYTFIAVLFVVKLATFILKKKGLEEKLTIKKVNLFIFLPFLTTIPFAILFSINKSSASFLQYGLISIVIDYFIVALYFYKRKEEIQKEDRSRVEKITILLSLVVPFSMIYAMYCYLFSQ